MPVMCGHLSRPRGVLLGVSKGIYKIAMASVCFAKIDLTRLALRATRPELVCFSS